MGFHLLAPIYHARCEDAFLKFLIFSPFEAKITKSRPIWHAIWFIPRNRRLLRPYNNWSRQCRANAVRTGTAVAHHTTVLKTHLRTRPMQPPRKRQRRAGDVENFQPPPALVVETVQSIAVQQPEEINIYPVIEQISPPAPRMQIIIDQDTPTLVRSMTVLEVENQEISE